VMPDRHRTRISGGIEMGPSLQTRFRNRMNARPPPQNPMFSIEVLAGVSDRYRKRYSSPLDF
jgi:hypothetical protein